MEATLLDRFRGDLDSLIALDARIGIAVSGGPDSLALLLLAAGARPGRIEAATIDHALRAGSCEEAEAVANVCESLGVPHFILTAEWETKPATAIQERARGERYRLLAQWAEDRNLAVIATAHHLDDQAETLIMRLARGAGVRGLAGMRALASVPGSDLPLLRPLLAWRHAELEKLCADAGLTPTHDPSNGDERFERVRVRRSLAEADWLDARSLGLSAAHLGEADAALDWAAAREWANAVNDDGRAIVYRPADAPAEIRRRTVSRAVMRLATEGQGAELRGRELGELLKVLGSGGQATIRGVRCNGGPEWRFAKAPPRKA